MHAVYELSTVKPHLPARPRYTLAELEIYSAGYYRALAMSLRVMQLAFRRQESRTMRDESTRMYEPTYAKPSPSAARDDDEEKVYPPAVYFVAFVVVVASLEVLTLGAVLILRLLR